ncbi:hypothetical protein [Candidatus Aalborgicola defluviihabitans]|uniref:hypothetical protein n=1 Tax=Candidatus Aalborgicola defluviihabitans TaxID=3386187 RepID=UPI0039B82794
MPAVITPRPGKAMRKDAALQILAKGLADIGLGRVVVALAVKLTGTGQLKPGLKMLGYGLVKQRALGVARVVELGFGTRWPTSRENALALGVQWRAWGSASVGWVPDDTGFISSFVTGRANHWARKYS